MNFNKKIIVMKHQVNILEPRRSKGFIELDVEQFFYPVRLTINRIINNMHCKTGLKLTIYTVPDA